MSIHPNWHKSTLKYNVGKKKIIRDMYAGFFINIFVPMKGVQVFYNPFKCYGIKMSQINFSLKRK